MNKETKKNRIRKLKLILGFLSIFCLPVQWITKRNLKNFFSCNINIEQKTFPTCKFHIEMIFNYIWKLIIIMMIICKLQFVDNHYHHQVIIFLLWFGLLFFALSLSVSCKLPLVHWLQFNLTNNDNQYDAR